jgi:hypothetical protein
VRGYVHSIADNTILAPHDIAKVDANPDVHLAQPS